MRVEFYAEAVKDRRDDVTGGRHCADNAADVADSRDRQARALAHLIDAGSEGEFEAFERLPRLARQTLFGLLTTLLDEAAAARDAVEEARQAATVRTFAGGD